MELCANCARNFENYDETTIYHGVSSTSSATWITSGSCPTTTTTIIPRTTVSTQSFLVSSLTTWRNDLCDSSTFIKDTAHYRTTFRKKETHARIYYRRHSATNDYRRSDDTVLISPDYRRKHLAVAKAFESAALSYIALSLIAISALHVPFFFFFYVFTMLLSMNDALERAVESYVQTGMRKYTGHTLANGWFIRERRQVT